jgi:2-dehydro-3-deoxyphosphogluconate aldolase / (4S)-4-hydroxy-2-oxoglutarate aldolase
MSVSAMAVREILGVAPVIPVIVINDVRDAAPLARALVDGGLRVLEVTLRTAAGVEAIRLMRDAVPEAIVGAGTVLNGAQLDAAVAAGSQFIVSPGFSRSLCQAGQAIGVPMLPGCVTASEVMAALDAGLDTLKFFPASRSGGAPLLKDFSAVFSQVRFCPTGGIDLRSATDYLALPNVLCVGMSSIATAEAIQSGDFAGITARAREAAGLRRP